MQWLYVIRSYAVCCHQGGEDSIGGQSTSAQGHAYYFTVTIRRSSRRWCLCKVLCNILYISYLVQWLRFIVTSTWLYEWTWYELYEILHNTWQPTRFESHTGNLCMWSHTKDSWNWNARYGFLFALSKMGMGSSMLLLPPPGRSHAHFAEREQEPTPGISILRILGMGSHTKIPGRLRYGIRNALLQIALIQSVHSVERWLLTDVNGHVIATELVYLNRRARSICLSYLWATFTSRSIVLWSMLRLRAASRIAALRSMRQNPEWFLTLTDATLRCFGIEYLGKLARMNLESFLKFATCR